MIFKSNLKQISFLLILLCVCIRIHAQDTSAHPNNSNNYNKVDSVIYRAASKSKFSYWLFKNIYEQPSPSNNEVNKKPTVKTDNYEKLSGKVIRGVYVKVLDPFGTNIDDTLIYNVGQLDRIGNTLSINTSKGNIRYQLLFKKNDPVDPLEIRESERLLRRQDYIRDARIYLKRIKNNPDSVDAIVIVQDRWSLNGSLGISTTSSDFNITESNFLGSGNRIKQEGAYNFNERKFTNWAGEFKDVNIQNTYIDGTLFYNTSPDIRYRGINFERTFFSPLTKWAGSAGFTRFNQDYIFIRKDETFIPSELRYDISDAWLGRSFPVSYQSLADRSTSIVFAARFVNTHYNNRPTPDLDTANIFQHSTIYLASFGFSTRRYYKDKKIFRFGDVEDVPEGRSLKIVAGKENKELIDYIYVGLSFSAGQHIEGLGYISGAAEYGTFYNDYIAQKGVFTINGTYFTDLWTRGKWSFRQFVYFRNTNGLNRDKQEFININGRNTESLYGFNSNQVLGKLKTLVKFESIIYTPFNFAGIQLATVVFAGAGRVTGNPFHPTINDKTIYQAYGMGFLIRKENLVVNTIRISLGYYPNIPQGSGAEYRFNPFSINNLNIRDFDIRKPELAPYR